MSGVVAPDRFLSLRFQLWGLVLAVAVPFLGLVGFLAYLNLGHETDSAQQDALGMAQLAATETAEVLEDAATVVTTIARRVAATGQLEPCERLGLTDFVMLEPEFSNAFVTDATGRLGCSAVPVPPGIEGAEDRDWFALAQTADSVVFGRPVIGRISGRWVFVAARAVRDSRDRLVGVVALGIDLVRFREAVLSTATTDTRLFVMVDREGVRLAHSRQPELVGRRARDLAIVETALTDSAGVGQGPDAGGVIRLWGYASVPRTGWRVVVGVNADEALRVARARLAQAAGVALAFTLAVLGLATLAARRIAQPIHALVEATTAVERGDFRPLVHHRGPAEVRRLGARFNAMVAARAISEASLRASEARFQRAFGASPMPMVISAWPTGKVIDVNDAYVATFGWARDDIIGRTALDIGLWRDPRDREGMRSELEASRPVRNREYEFRKKSGETVIGLFSADRIELDGQPCVISLFVDVTDRRRLELQLRQAQKMEALGQLTGGIAHDFNNLLTAVLGNAELIAAGLPADRQDLRSELDDIRAAAKRGAAMVKKLLAFSRKERLETVTVDLAEVVRDVSGMLRHLVPETIRIDTRGIESGVWVPADRSALDQILINLVTNARDAMPHGGDLLLVTRRATIDAAFRAKHGWGEPGEYGLLAVRDTGTGMSNEARAHLFEPFFTTKPREQGTGLGMAMVYGLVKQHGGFVNVESEIGKGTNVLVYLPAAKAPGIQPARATAQKAPVGRETILLVEDDALIREAGRRALESRGYEVITATDGEHALQLLEREPGRVALVVTDVVMPRRSGPELFQAVRGQPDAPAFLFTSGYAEVAGGPQGAVPPGADLLPKPWSVADLVSRVRVVLDRAARA